ncbi:MAG: polymerase sigma-70 factor, subfamily [Acidobacteriaceae bacterium]|nr:polymerase sigma-70 factor, subfamily [Acidobacteriaceae bacterium]
MYQELSVFPPTGRWLAVVPQNGISGNLPGPDPSGPTNLFRTVGKTSGLVPRFPPRFPIAAVLAEARTAASTDWRQIAALYTRLLGIQPSAVVELNRAVAIAMRDGPEKGLRLIEDLLERKELADYYLAHSARAELCRKLGRLA